MVEREKEMPPGRREEVSLREAIFFLPLKPHPSAGVHDPNLSFPVRKWANARTF